MFFDDAKFITKLLQRVIDIGMIHFVDNARHKEKAWVTNQMVVGACFFNISENETVTFIESYEDINYSEGIIMLYSDTPFAYSDFIYALMDPESDLDPYFPKFGFYKSTKETPKEEKCKQKRNLEEVEITREQDNYTFDMFFDDENDVMFYEICKPNTDRPFCTYIEDFSLHGHIRLFPTLFVSSVWGVAKNDIPFLEQLWDHLEIPGICNLETLVKDCVKECYGGAPEPKLWRTHIEDLKRVYFGKK